MPFTYILRCADGTLYVGSTIDLGRRFDQHQRGEGALYTRRRRPVELVWQIEFESIADAFALEKQLQGWSHAKRLLVVESEWDALAGWSKRHG